MTRWRVLVVEDDAVQALALGAVLRELGHDVCATVASQGAAIEAAPRLCPDMIIIDRRLGGGSGQEALRQIQLTGAIPHVLVSGDAGDAGPLPPGAAVLRKPFTERELADAMARAGAAPRPVGANPAGMTQPPGVSRIAEA